MAFGDIRGHVWQIPIAIHTTNEFITTYGAFCSLLMDRGIVSYCSMIVYLQLTEIHKITIIKLSNRAFKFDRISANVFGVPSGTNFVLEF